jgi:hypothetical protein
VVVDEEGEEDDPEHPASASSNGASQSTLPAVWERPGCDLVNILLINIPLWRWTGTDRRLHAAAEEVLSSGETRRSAIRKKCAG